MKERGGRCSLSSPVLVSRGGDVSFPLRWGKILFSPLRTLTLEIFWAGSSSDWGSGLGLLRFAGWAVGFGVNWTFGPVFHI